MKVCDIAVGSGAFLVEACRQLGDELVKAWHVHDSVPKLPPDEEMLHARRLISQRCLYGVDRNPMAVDLAKLSLWLATLAKDHPFTFLDHSIRAGDSLVGLSRKQISGFHWLPSQQRDIEGAIIDTRIRRATDYRKKILQARDDVGYVDQSSLLALADDSLAIVRLTGDLVIAAFFSADKDKARRQKCDELFGQLSIWFAKGMRTTEREPLGVAIAELRGGNHPITPFHWEIEFPEVFLHEIGGFDAIVGNPPFLAGCHIWPTYGGEYRDFIQLIHPNTGGKAVDIVAHFFRRAYELLRRGGSLGLLATNTIAKGDTREAGLQHITEHGGVIYCAIRRMAWPGIAAVVVSVVHISKFGRIGDASLDGKLVFIITSFLFSGGTNANPACLKVNADKSYRGHAVYGMGFSFDDSSTDGVASSTAEMNRLVEKDHRNAERIFPFIGGEEINRSPTHAGHRFIICFAEMSEEEAERWPDLMEVIRRKVLPERAKLGGYGVADQRRLKWWRFGSYAAALQRAIDPLPRCLALSQVSAHHAVAFQPTSTIFAHTAIIFPLASHSAFGVLQSRAHEFWGRFFASSMKDDMRYTPSDCFENFPFPAGVLENAAALPRRWTTGCQRLLKLPAASATSSGPR